MTTRTLSVALIAGLAIGTAVRAQSLSCQTTATTVVPLPMGTLPYPHGYQLTNELDRSGLRFSTRDDDLPAGYEVGNPADGLRNPWRPAA